jgi:hypothetical protein
MSDGPDGIACWFIDTACNEESFFVRRRGDEGVQGLKTSADPGRGISVMVKLDEQLFRIRTPLEE